MEAEPRVDSFLNPRNDSFGLCSVLAEDIEMAPASENEVSARKAETHEQFISDVLSQQFEKKRTAPQVRLLEI